MYIPMLGFKNAIHKIHAQGTIWQNLISQVGYTNKMRPGYPKNLQPLVVIPYSLPIHNCIIAQTLR